MSTIVALSSGRPPAAIGIVRVSGSRALDAATALAGTLPPPRCLGLRSLRDGSGNPLDRALVTHFPGPGTATGEDLVELHCHGGRAVIDAVIAALLARPDCRLAEPGEFTRRALAAGRIDLAEAEGLADLLEAETERQRIAALAAAEGRVSRTVDAWMEAVATLSARIEVLIDYDDEEGTEPADVAAIVDAARSLGREIGEAVAAPPVERIRDGIRIAIAGPPNAGKSTLLNLLSERDAAIVSPIAGTTRDVIEVPVRRDGMAFVLLDTAGLTVTDDRIEAIGVERARAVTRSADLVLWLGDGPPPSADAIHLHARADLKERKVPSAGTALAVQRDDPASIAALWQLIGARASTLIPQADAVPWRARHRTLCLAAAAALVTTPDDPLLLAEHLRRAGTELAAIVGRDATEQMLDSMFSRFCLGK